MMAAYSYADAQPFTRSTLPDPARKVVIVFKDDSHGPFEASNVALYIARHGEAPHHRWSYAEPCECEACTWEPPER